MLLLILRHAYMTILDRHMVSKNKTITPEAPSAKRTSHCSVTLSGPTWLHHLHKMSTSGYKLSNWRENTQISVMIKQEEHALPCSACLWGSLRSCQLCDHQWSQTRQCSLKTDNNMVNTSDKPNICPIASKQYRYTNRNANNAAQPTLNPNSPHTHKHYLK